MIPRVLSPYEQTQLARYGPALATHWTKTSRPIEQVTQRVEFCNHVFCINNSTLIPRIETTELVEKLANWCQDQRKNTKLNIAEVGTGCGAIGISLALDLAQKNIHHQLMMTDVSKASLSMARLNARRLLKKHRESFYIKESDLLSSIPTGIRFDLIVANLPYIPDKNLKSLPTSVTSYEPKIALRGGPDGLTLIRRLIWQARRRLKKHGLLALEIDQSHDKSHWRGWQREWQVSLIKDSFGKLRFAWLTKKEGKSVP